ncbi:hypothetical protein RA280_21365 [Cupriavidus sp. CV2]|uniref:hypothetical protein n=1 Tax=Cupriavidus ulmosensis TaxID=3065913 RepID=UPI00296B17E6|nr:hypothetical protein [Cupriavidus sp. CV2]MDW3684255.1 hypothetical protein [Cupriavidus sp. CV2]
MKPGQFSFAPGGNEMKQFSFNLNEVLTYANTATDYAAIVSVKIPTNALHNFGFSKTIDPFIFKSGVLSVEEKAKMELFNSLLKYVEHAF